MNKKSKIIICSLIILTSICLFANIALAQTDTEADVEADTPTAPTAPTAATCRDRWLDSQGDCTAAGVTSCPQGQVEDTQPGLCSNGKCCHNQASTSGAISNLELQIPLFDYTVAQNIPTYIGTIYQYAVIIIIPLAIMIIIISGIYWISAAGNNAMIKKAQSYIINALIGLGLALGSYIIFSLLNLGVLTLPGLQYVQPDADFDLGTASDPSLTPAELSALQSSNPYKAICDQYNGSYNETVAQKCKTLGTNPPPGMNIVSMGSYGADSSQRASADGLAAFKKAADCVKAKFGKNITATGWRSAQRQYEIKQEKGKWAAKPCCSNHGTGAAFDVKINGAGVQDWGTSDRILKDCFAQSGLYAKIKGGSISEPWHFSPSGH